MTFMDQIGIAVSLVAVIYGTGYFLELGRLAARHTWSWLK